MIGAMINGKYELLQVLSESHQFEVFSALERETGATVVVKLLREEMCDHQERIQLFCDEVRSFAALSHPNIVHILDIDLFGRRPYVVTERIEGIELKSWMQNSVPTFKEAGRTIRDLTAVLQYAFDQKVGRRSIKLSNVFRLRDGSLKVLAFSHPRLKLVGAETRGNEEAGGIQSDLFFLGTTMFEILAGESPIRKRGGLHELWESRLRQALRMRHPHLTPEDIDKVVGFLDRTLTRSVQRRFDSHAAFLIGLSDLIHISDGALRKERRPMARAAALATAADVVDAIHGLLPMGSGGAIHESPLHARPPKRGVTAQTAPVGAANASCRGGFQTRPSSPPEEEATEPGSAGPRGRPLLRVVPRTAPPKESGAIWHKADEQGDWLHHLLPPMGGLLLLMILLLIFW